MVCDRYERRAPVAGHDLERGAAQLVRQVVPDGLEPANQVLERLAGDAGAGFRVRLDMVPLLVGIQEREQFRIARGLAAGKLKRK